MASHRAPARRAQLLPGRCAGRTRPLPRHLPADRPALGRSLDRPGHVDRRDGRAARPDPGRRAGRPHRPSARSCRRRGRGDAGLAGPAAVCPEFALVAHAMPSRRAAGSMFAPAMAAISLGIVGPKAFARRIGRNEAFNHAGNALRGADRRRHRLPFGPIVVFWLMAVLAVASIAARWRSRPRRSTRRGPRAWTTAHERRARAALRASRAAVLAGRC